MNSEEGKLPARRPLLTTRSVCHGGPHSDRMQIINEEGKRRRDDKLKTELDANSPSLPNTDGTRNNLTLPCSLY